MVSLVRFLWWLGLGVDLNWLSLPLEIGIDYSLQHLSLYELGIEFKS